MSTTPAAPAMDTQYLPDGSTYQIPAVQNYGPNPWSSISQGDQQTAMNSSQDAQQRISTLQGQMDQGGGYPAMANSYGLGTQTPGPTQGMASNPSYMSQPVNINMPDSGSRGFNPWSLQGESNARGK